VTKEAKPRGWTEAHVVKKKEWVGLTDNEMAEILCDDKLQFRPELMMLAVQAKLKEKNT